MYHLFKVTLIIFLSLSYSYSQVFSEIPSITAKMNYACVSNQHNLAIVGGKEHYKSTDQGVTWIEMDNSVGSELYQVEGFSATIINDSTICVLGRLNTKHTIIRTTDGGNTWATVLLISGSELKDIEAKGNIVIATATYGIYRSIDSGLSWTFHSLTPERKISPFIRYNEGADSWIVGNYTTNFHISHDNGITWEESNLGFPASEVLAATKNMHGIILSRGISPSTHLIFLDETNNPQALHTVHSNLLMNNNNNLSRTGVFLPNNKLLTHNNFGYYLVDLADSNLYHISPPAANGFQPRTIAIGTTYGITFGTNNIETQSKVYRIDLTQQPTISVPPYFNISGPGPCAGDNIIATPNANYADSYEWYINNILVSTDNILNYPTPPNIYTTYNIKLNTYYNGIMTTYSRQHTMSAPKAPHQFTYNVNTRACYGEPLYVFIDPENGTPTPSTTMIKILHNGQLVYGPLNMTGNNIHAYTSPITESGILQIVTYKSLYCDPSSDTVNINIEISPNLFDFELLPHDSIICPGQYPSIEISGTNANYTYSYHSTFSLGTAYTTPSVTVQGNSNGVVTIIPAGVPADVNNSIYIDLHSPIFMYVNMKVNDNEGCSPQRIIDTIRIQRSKAYFELHSRSFLRSDTVQLSNAFITPNRLWSSQTLDSSFISNKTDTIPLIAADTTGFVDINLRNEPIEGCINSMKQYIHYADPSEKIEDFCQAIKTHEKDYLHHVRTDQYGDIYEIRVYPVTNYVVPMYILRKNDSFGNLLWEKKAIYNGWPYGNISGIVIEEMDFDVDGNPVLAMWIQGERSYQDDLINYNYTLGSNVKGACYITKVNRHSGNVIWSSNLGQMAPSAELVSRSRVTDVVVDGNLIHATTYNNYDLDFYTLNSQDGTLIHTEPFDFGTRHNTDFISPSFHLYTGSLSDNRQSFWSPQIDVLSTGEVVAVGNYRGVNLPLYPQLKMTNSETGLFIMKYHPDNGIYDVQNIAKKGNVKTPSNTFVYDAVPKMFVDKNDNIIVASFWEVNTSSNNPISSDVRILDSVMLMKTGTFVVSMDKDYNMNWLTTGPHSQIEDLAYSPLTEEIYLVSKTRHNFSLGKDTTHIMLGEIDYYDPNYTYLPYSQHPRLDFPFNSGFLTKLNSAGTPTKMKKIEYITPNQNGSDFISIRISANPCGDVALFANHRPIEAVINVDGQSYEIDSIMLFLLYSNCTMEGCSYLNAPDSIKICGNNNTIDIQLKEHFNLNTVTFDIIVDNEVVSSNLSSTVINGQFTVSPPITPNGEFTLVFNAPNIDTIIIIRSDLQVNFEAPTENIVCISSPAIPLNNVSPTGGIFSGNGVNSNYFHPEDAGVGIHTIKYIYTDPIGCILSDSNVIIVSLYSEEEIIFGEIPNVVCINHNAFLLENTTPLGGVYSGTGINSSIFNPQIAGIGNHVINYTYTDSIGCIASDSMFILVDNCLSINGENKQDIGVYPNPFTNKIDITLSNVIQNNLEVKIYDYTGRTVFQEDIKAFNLFINASDLSQGNYTLEILDNKNCIYRKQMIKL